MSSSEQTQPQVSPTDGTGAEAVGTNAAPFVYIRDLGNYEGQEVTVRGWVQHHRGKGKLAFIVVRDGSGVCQTVAFKGDLSEETWESVSRLTLESSLAVTGAVKRDERAPGGFEMALRGLYVYQFTKDYPIAEKEHGIGFLMEHRHMWLRSTRQNAALKLRSTVVKAIRDYLDDNGFTLADTPILTPNAVEGTSNLFETDYFGQPAFLAQSGQLYNEANIGSLGKVYCFGPTFRAEKSKTRRHLMEFWMVEPEVAFLDLEGLLKLEESLVSFVVQRALETRQEELKVLERDTTPLERVIGPFPRITYDRAIEILRAEHNPEIQWGEDLGGDEETAISTHFDKPVFITHYPTNIKAFYMQPVADRPEIVLAADLIAPEGYGEICGGSQRIDDLELLETRLREHNLPIESYEWYLDLRRFGTVPHSGFGMGVERVVAWIGGLAHVRETIPFPRLYEWCRP